MVHTKKKKKKQTSVLYVSFFCSVFTVSILVLIYVHGLAEFSRFLALFVKLRCYLHIVKYEKCSTRFLHL